MDSDICKYSETLDSLVKHFSNSALICNDKNLFPRAHYFWTPRNFFIYGPEHFYCLFWSSQIKNVQFRRIIFRNFISRLFSCFYLNLLYLSKCYMIRLGLLCRIIICAKLIQIIIAQSWTPLPYLNYLNIFYYPPLLVILI